MQYRQLKEGIEQAFARHYGELETAIYTDWPEAIYSDAASIMVNLSDNLWRYRRAPDSRFLQWATAWVRRHTRRHRFLTELFTNHHQLVYAAIERSLYACPGEDWAIEPSDHEADLFIHLLEHPRKIDALLKPTKAKDTTMLFALAKSRMRAVRSKLTDRHRIVSERQADFYNTVREVADTPEPDEEKLQAA